MLSHYLTHERMKIQIVTRMSLTQQQTRTDQDQHITSYTRFTN
jgi:hypothetical protein